MRRPSFPSTILLLGLAFAARADDRARLISVTAAGDADSAVIAFEGDRPLSFTTLQLQSPPRVVVDFADTSVAGVPAELSVEDGTVRRVATAEVGAGTARVVIELAADAEFDVRAKGNRLEVRVARIAPAVAVAPIQVPRPAEPPERQPVAAEPAAQPPAQVAQAPAQVAPAPAQPETPPAPSPSEAEKRASLPTVSLVGSHPSPQPEPKPPSPAELKKQRAAEKLLAQKLALQQAAEAKKRAREQKLALAKDAADKAAEAKRAAAEKRATQAAEKKAIAAKAAADKRAAQEARALAAAEQQKKSREAAAAEPPRRAKAPPAPVETKTLTVQEAMALRAAAEKGLPTGLGPPEQAAKPAPPPSPPAEKRRVAKAEPSRAADSSRIAINSIGFRPVGNGEVIIRSDRPLTYGVGGDERSVLLHLPGSAIPRPNDRRPLDTHFFDGPVLRVVPIDVPGGIDLRIELRAKAEYALSQQGAVLTVAFSAPR